MIRGSLLSCLPKGFFSWQLSPDDGSMDENSYSMDLTEVGKKRRRDSAVSVGGSRTPTLVTPRRFSVQTQKSVFPEDENDRPFKRFRGHSKIVSVPKHITGSKRQTQQKRSRFLSKTPDDVVAHCLSFLGSAEDRRSLQMTCKLFRDLSNSDPMLAQVSVAGNLETGKLGIIQDHDTPATAAAALAPFARAGNLEALYMLGIVKCYCYQDLRNGILMLKMASYSGFVRSSYTLGIILRDAMPEEAARFMNLAASTRYLPALQELLPAREMKERFGEPNADELRRHLDPMCLNRLLLRDYVDSAELRGLNTSHCWNPLCGRWAYKATNANAAVRVRRGWGLEYDLEGETEPIVDLGIATSLRRRTIAVLEDGMDVATSLRKRTIAALEDQMEGAHDVQDTIPARTAAAASSNADGTNLTPTTVTPTKPVQASAWIEGDVKVDRVSRMKMCSRCCRAKYCSKLCQVYDWRSSQHKMECQFLS